MSAPRLLAPTTISGGVPTAGAGTLNTIALWTPDGNTLGNSLLTQAGNIVTNASGAIRANGTTQASPAFTRHDTTTSGIYFPATNEIGFTISSQHAMFISTGRNVGIGTTSPGSRVSVRSNTTSAGATPVYTFQINRQNSDTAGFLLGSDGNLDAALAVNGDARSIRLGKDVSGTFTEWARIDSAGNFGIGTASPASYISASSTVLAVASPGGNLGTVRVSNTSTFASGNQAEFFASTTGVGLWGSTNCPVLFYANNVERMRLNPAGTQAQSQVAIGTSSFTSGCSLTVAQSIDASQSGQGLKLPATPGNADTQTLDCYQENTWTATDGSGAGLTFTANNTAVYTRVGRLVHARIDITFPSTANGSNALVLLPFNAIAYGGTAFVYASGVGSVMMLANSTGIEFYTAAGVRMTNGALSTLRIIGSIVYQAA